MDATPIWAKKNGSDTYPLANHLKDTAAAALALYGHLPPHPHASYYTMN